MSGHLYEFHGGAVEYELRCDGCGGVFRCGDDSYFSWPVLCDAAEAEGWRVNPGLADDHTCPRCAARAPRAVLPRPRATTAVG
jgi:hypothetical protein